MKKEFWLEKWQNKQTGFHKTQTHPLLIQFINEFNLSKGDTVFVPLCGKTLDMLWLNQQGYRVIGIEISQLAVEEFFDENNLPYSKSGDDFFTIYQYENICIYLGDFFDLTQSHLKDVKFIYDRAALIALPDELVLKYVDKLFDLAPNGIQELLITLELERTSGPKGPPFSTSDSKVVKLFNDFNQLKLLYQEDIIQREAGFKKQGCEFVYERAYLIKK